jgi:hypothetical protein
MINVTISDLKKNHYVFISGLRNPVYSGMTPNNSYLVKITTWVLGNEYEVLKQYLDGFMFYSSSGSNNLYMNIYSSSFFKNVTSDSYITLQTSTYLATKSSIVL